MDRRGTMRFALGTLIVTLLSTVAGAQPTPPTSARTATLPPAIEAVQARWAAAVLASDTSAMGDVFTPDVEWRVAGSADVVGRGALLQWHADPARPHITSFTRRTEEFVPMGDYSYEAGRTLMTRRAASDTADRQVTIRYTILWKRAPDGTWQVHRYLDNTAPRPPRPTSN